MGQNTGHFSLHVSQQLESNAPGLLDTFVVLTAKDIIPNTLVTSKISAFRVTSNTFELTLLSAMCVGTLSEIRCNVGVRDERSLET